MEQQQGDTCTMPPFWAAEHRDRRRLRRSYSLLLTSTSLLVIFLVLVLVFSLIVVPTLRSFASNILRPRTVKNSWDSLNLVLVLFAIVCGFLSRNNTAETLTPRSHYHNHATFSTPPPHSYHYNHYHTPYGSFNRLRSFNSYPDLRQQLAGEERFRFYDDTYLLRHHTPDSEEEQEKQMVIQNAATTPPPPSQAVRRKVQRAYQAETVEKHVTNDSDAMVLPPSPPPTRPKSVRRNVKRAYQVETVEKHDKTDLGGKISPPFPATPAAETRPVSVRRNSNRAYQVETIEKHEANDLPEMDSLPPPAMRTKGVRRDAYRANQAETVEQRKTNDLDSENSPSPPSATQTKDVRRNASPEINNSVVKSSPPRPRPPPPPPPPQLPAEVKTGKKKRGSATKEFLTSLRGKKKKQRQRSVENFDSILIIEPLCPQPPPPPPPPPKVFQNLFSLKKGKHKISHSVSVATASVSNQKEDSSYKLMTAGNESSLIPIPPPPPPPPFKLPAWKFRVQGDYVRVDSTGSSRSGSPDLDEASVDTPTSTHDDTSQCNSPFAKDGEDSASMSAPSLFCPSPDVDTKARNFIESFRAGLRMAKMNSMKERQGIGRSNLGPSPNHECLKFDQIRMIQYKLQEIYA
ncbi:hypothetical protein Fmac_012364 [Flemingia macrophylla]|uniref:Hydroxyproline-rich glycoprotein family protein n=1 Tax=Flemingia macrophylla TaxID=520843 RepID=A0ABD1MQ25_9FABA